MIIVTGGAGFIGSNIVKGLNERGIKDVVVIDDLTDGHKYHNLLDCSIQDYLDKDEFLKLIQTGKKFPRLKGIFHQGACSTTTEWDGRFMLQNNYEYSKQLLHYCATHNTPFIYASSAATYGGNTTFKEEPANEAPLNVYGYSKLLFDQYLRRNFSHLRNQVIGLRYFNVYGPREQHKGSMASVAFHLNNQIKKEGVVKLFEGCDGYGAGEQRRDFIYIDDVVKVNLWFLDHPKVSGIFNVGTGRSQPFNDVANAVIDWHGHGQIQYIAFPEHLRNHYQSFTQADISALRQVGYQENFHTVSEGVTKYLNWLEKPSSANE